MTGTSAESGFNFNTGIEIALELLEEQGGLEHYELEFYYEDDKSDPTAGLSAVEKLVYENEVDVVMGHILSIITMVTMPVCEEAGVPLLCPGSNSTLSQQGYKYFNRTQVTNRSAGYNLVIPYFIEEYGCKRFAMVNPNDEQRQEMYQVAVETLEKYGLELVYHAAYNQEDTDFAGIIMEMKEANPDCYLLCTEVAEGGQFQEQLTQLVGPATEILVHNGAASQNTYLDVLGIELAEGTFYESGWNIFDESELNQYFVNQFKEKTGLEPAETASRGFDIVFVLAEALKILGKYDTGADDFRDKLQESIRKVDYEGIMGHFVFDENGDSLYSKNMFRFVDGKRTFIAALVDPFREE